MTRKNMAVKKLLKNPLKELLLVVLMTTISQGSANAQVQYIDNNPARWTVMTGINLEEQQTSEIKTIMAKHQLPQHQIPAIRELLTESQRTTFDGNLEEVAVRIQKRRQAEARQLARR
jgi:Spy/CpxP family protein refolding chaperone